MSFNTLCRVWIISALGCAALLPDPSPLFAQTLGQKPVFTLTGEIPSQAPPQYSFSYPFNVVIDGDTAAIAERGGRDPASPGTIWSAVTVLSKQNGQWVRQAQFNVDTPQQDNASQFGMTLALKGDTLVVGAQNRGQLTEGAVFVYRRTGDTWALEAQLDVPEESYFFRQLGNAVAIDPLTGNRILVSTGNYTGAENRTAVYVFDRTPEGWKRQATLRPEELSLSPLNLARVALQGNTALITAPLRAEAYTFTRKTDGSWTQGQTLWGYRSALLGVGSHLDNNRVLLGATYSHTTLEYLDPFEARIAETEGDALLFEKGLDGRWDVKSKFRDVLVDAGVTDLQGLGISTVLDGRVAVVSEGTNWTALFPLKTRVHVLTEAGGRWWLNQIITSEENEKFDPVYMNGPELWVGHRSGVTASDRTGFHLYSR